MSYFEVTSSITAEEGAESYCMNNLEEITWSGSRITIIVRTCRVTFNLGVMCYLSPFISDLVKSSQGCSNLHEPIFLSLPPDISLHTVELLSDLLASGVCDNTSKEDIINIYDLLTLLGMGTKVHTNDMRIKVEQCVEYVVNITHEDPTGSNICTTFLRDSINEEINNQSGFLLNDSHTGNSIISPLKDNSDNDNGAIEVDGTVTFTQFENDSEMYEPTVKKDKNIVSEHGGTFEIQTSVQDEREEINLKMKKGNQSAIRIDRRIVEAGINEWETIIPSDQVEVEKPNGNVWINKTVLDEMMITPLSDNEVQDEEANVDFDSNKTNRGLRKRKSSLRNIEDNLIKKHKNLIKSPYTVDMARPTGGDFKFAYIWKYFNDVSGDKQTTDAQCAMCGDVFTEVDTMKGVPD